MYSKIPPAFDSVAATRGKSPIKTQKVLNKKGVGRRFTHKMTLGDSESEVFSCRFDPTDKYLAAGFGDGAIRVYNTQTGKCAFTLCSSLD
jgi:COMPASS component SWD3